MLFLIPFAIGEVGDPWMCNIPKKDVSKQYHIVLYFQHKHMSFLAACIVDIYIYILARCDILMAFNFVCLMVLALIAMEKGYAR